MWLLVRARFRSIEARTEGDQLIWAAVAAIILLNFADAAFTLLWINTGIATEANVLLANLVEHHAVGFSVVKSALVSLGMLLLWRQCERPLAAFGICLAFATYNALLMYHVGICALALTGACV